MSLLIQRNCFGIVVAQEKDNGYINITKLAKAYQKQTGKRRDASEWLSNKRTKESINHLNSVTGIPVTELIQVRQGGSPEHQGTFVHPKLALRFAIWLSDEFGYMVEQWFEEWATGHFKTQQEKEETKITLEDALALANFAASSAQNAGVSKPVAESIKLNSIMQCMPFAKPLLLPQKKAIASANPIEEQALTPTEIGIRLAQRLGIPKISARAVNKKLLSLGYQVSVTRIKKATGKEVHDYYKPTQKTIDGNYGHLEMSTYQTGDAHSTKYQLRWRSGIIDFLVNNWQE